MPARSLGGIGRRSTSAADPPGSWARGHLPDAIARMRHVVLEQDPDYYWGWLNLTEWTGDAATPAEYLEAAEGLVRLAGNDPVAAGYRADARLRTGDRASGQGRIPPRLHLGADQDFNALRLFDLERDRRGSRRRCPGARVHQGSRRRPVRRGPRGQLALARGDRSTAAEALTRLCTMPPMDSEWPLTAAGPRIHRSRQGPPGRGSLRGGPRPARRPSAGGRSLGRALCRPARLAMHPPDRWPFNQGRGRPSRPGWLLRGPGPRRAGGGLPPASADTAACSASKRDAGALSATP